MPNTADTHVVTRRSTDVHTADDRELAKALRFIRDNAVLPINVDDVVGQVECSRRALELRFRRILARSINEEIRAVRLDRAKRLLEETGLSVARITEAVGLGSASYLIRLFRGQLGKSPTQYQAALRRGKAVSSFPIATSPSALPSPNDSGGRSTADQARQPREPV